MQTSEAQVIRAMCKKSFYFFLKTFWHCVVLEKPVFNWHVKYLCDELQIVAERVFRGEAKLYDLVINVPPGTTKSTICSQMFPAWVWIRMGHAQLIHISYAHAIALKDSIRCRDIIQSDLFQLIFPEIQLREDENTKGLFMNTKRGYRLSVGMMGSITGQHGHFLVIDDPLNPEEAFSDAELMKANRWMENSLPLRKVDKAVTVTVLIQQRLHQADPSGEVLERTKGVGIKHINLPGEETEAISPPEMRENYVDGLLDPVRLSRKVLDSIRTDIGEYAYAAQILQSPVPLGGGQFQVNKFNQAQELPEKMVRWVRSWDKAGTPTSKNKTEAWTVGVLMGVDRHGRYWIADVIRDRLSAVDREELILQTAIADAAAHTGIEIIVEMEGGSGGVESGEYTVRNLAGFRIHVYRPTGEKEVRAYPYSAQVGGGNVFVLIRHWTKEFIEEHRFFPFSKYKDQVDAAGAAFSRLHKKKKRVGGISALLRAA